MSLKAGFFQLFYFTFLHNADAIAYLVGILFIFALLIKKPSRVLILFLLGFILLELRFQYLKHIVDPLYDQTVGAMIQTSSFLKTRKFFDILLNDLVPMGLYVGGWGSMMAGMLFSRFSPEIFKKKIVK
ncbi:MAG: hypothetical protein ABI425_05920 [Patescibacteria group bacterium]